jgi:MOSC domain-containing protein YiiM
MSCSYHAARSVRPGWSRSEIVGSGDRLEFERAPKRRIAHDDRVESIEIVTVNTALPSVLLRYPGGEVVSGIDKRPVDAPTLYLSTLNLAGDEQADQRRTPAGGQVHGGPDQAVYAFPVEHYPRVSELTGGQTWPGYMGENVTLRGATEAHVFIGDVWLWGDAELQVSAPRGPCYKLGIRMGKQALRTVIREEVLTGWYLRVLREGEVPTSGTIRVVSRDHAGISVAVVQRAIQDRRNTYPDLADHPSLSVNARTALKVPDRDIVGGVPETD